MNLAASLIGSSGDCLKQQVYCMYCNICHPESFLEHKKFKLHCLFPVKTDVLTLLLLYHIHSDCSFLALTSCATPNPVFSF